METENGYTGQEALKTIETKLGNVILSELWDECHSLAETTEERKRKRRRKLQDGIFVGNLVGFSSSPTDTEDPSGCKETTTDIDTICTRVRGHFTLYTEYTTDDDTTFLIKNRATDVVKKTMSHDNYILYTKMISKITYVDAISHSVKQGLQEPVNNSTDIGNTWLIAPGFVVAMTIALVMYRTQRSSAICKNKKKSDLSLCGSYDLDDIAEERKINDSILVESGQAGMIDNEVEDSDSMDKGNIIPSGLLLCGTEE